MAILEIKKYPDKILKKKCKPVKDITPEIKKLIKDMFDTMYTAPGVGLAASQVGIPLRICVIDPSPSSSASRQPLALINPKIVQKRLQRTEEEGCLSLPGLSRKVKRFGKVVVEAVNEKGLPIVVEGNEMLARVLQHEIDHLDGIIFIDYLPWWQKIKVKREISKRKKQGTW
jgi:peptide deformylase